MWVNINETTAMQKAVSELTTRTFFSEGISLAFRQRIKIAF